MTEKPRINYQDMVWLVAFSQIQEKQKLTADGIEYTVAWKHEDPPWIQLRCRLLGKVTHLMVKKGDPLLMQLKPVTSTC